MIIIWMQTTTAILLVFQRKIKTKKTFISKQKYYSTLDRAISSTAELVLRDKISSGEIDTLNSALSELQNINSELVRIINIAINKG